MSLAGLQPDPYAIEEDRCSNPMPVYQEGSILGDPKKTVSGKMCHCVHTYVPNSKHPCECKAIFQSS